MAMLVLSLCLFATSAGDTARSGRASILRSDAGRVVSPARLAPVPGARHEDQAASRRVHVPVAVAVRGFLPSPERSARARYSPPSLAPLTPSTIPSSQRDPPAIG